MTTEGNLGQIRSSNANGVWTDYGYDGLNRLETVTDQRMGGASTSYRYDEVGNLAGYTYANGVRTDYAYNSLNRLESVTMRNAGESILASFGYTLGAAGNRTGVTEATGRTITYTYDDLYRLTGETIANDPTGANGAIGYVYDDVGNRLGRTSTHPALANQTASYDANDRVATEQYDANGNTVGANGQGYGWDAENRLTVLNAGTANEVRYAYDGDGNRVAKTEGGETTRYLVDTMNPTGYAQTVEELTEPAGQAAAVSRRYAYGLDLISQEQVIGGVWTASWYGYDGHGNVRSLTDAAGAVTDRYDYDAYGTLIASAGATPNEYLYTGERFDPALGFSYLRARYLDPGLGRFAGMDSYEGEVGEPASLHKYSYCQIDPVSATDPSGNSPQEFLMTVALVGILASISLAFINVVAQRYAAPIGVNDEPYIVDGSGWTEGSAATSLNRAVGVWASQAGIVVNTSPIRRVSDPQLLDISTLSGSISENVDRVLKLIQRLKPAPRSSHITVFVRNTGQAAGITVAIPPSASSVRSVTFVSGTVIHPNYLVVAHEWGHSFGLGDNSIPEQVFTYNLMNALVCAPYLTVTQARGARMFAAKHY